MYHVSAQGADERMIKSCTLSQAIQTAKRKTENVEWEGVTGSLAPGKIAASLDHGTHKAVVTVRPIRFELSTSRTWHCWQTKGLSQSKNKHKPTAIEGSRMWKEKRTYRLFSKPRLGAIRPPFTLSPLHTKGEEWERERERDKM